MFFVLALAPSDKSCNVIKSAWRNSTDSTYKRSKQTLVAKRLFESDQESPRGFNLHAGCCHLQGPGKSAKRHRMCQEIFVLFLLSLEGS